MALFFVSQPKQWCKQTSKYSNVNLNEIKNVKDIFIKKMQKVLSVICTVEYRQILSVQNSRRKSNQQYRLILKY